MVHKVNIAYFLVREFLAHKYIFAAYKNTSLY